MNPRWMLTLLVALALTMAACGDDDSASSPTPAASTTTAPTDRPADTASPVTSSTSNATATPISTANPAATPADHSTVEIDECELVTLADISDATGEQFTQGGTYDVTDPDICSFESDGGWLVQISAYNLSGDQGGAKASFEFLPSILGNTILDSPGDEAYYNTVFGLAILVNNRYELDIYVGNATGEIQRDPAFEIGEKAVANMP